MLRSSACVPGFLTSLRNMTGNTVSFRIRVFLFEQTEWLHHHTHCETGKKNLQCEKKEVLFVFGCRNVRESRDPAGQDVNLSSLISTHNHSSRLPTQIKKHQSNKVVKLINRGNLVESSCIITTLPLGCVIVKYTPERKLIFGNFFYCLLFSIICFKK